MSNPLDKIFISEEVFEEKMDNLILAVHGVGATNGGSVGVRTWKQIQQLVRAGLAEKYFSVGDILYVEKEKAINATCSNNSVTVTVNAETFVAAIGEAGTLDYEATYDGIEWHKENGDPVNLTSYGITVSGTPVANDKIVIHETADSIPFVIVDFDKETPEDTTRTHSMTCVMLNTFTGVQFCATQALFYCPSGLPAGSYSFSIKSGYQNSYGGGSTLYFTLANAVPSGGLIMFPWGYNTQASATKISTYASSTATSATESNVSVSTTEISGATYIGEIGNVAIQEVTVGSVTVKINNVERARYGSNNWEESAIRQWCNSSNAKGSVWVPKNVFDRPPSWATSLDGFMYGLDPELVSVIGEVNKVTNKNSVTDGGGTVTTKEKCFLISMGELGVTGYSAEGSQYKYWQLLMDGTAIADWSTHSELIKTNAAGTAQYWWMRSPNTGNATNARNVYTSGSVNNYNAYIGGQAVVGFAII